MPLEESISDDDWERQRSRILGYHLEEDKSLGDVMELMSVKHEFSASRQEYLTQFSKWNVEEYLNTRTRSQIEPNIRHHDLEPDTGVINAFSTNLSSKKLKNDSSRELPITTQSIPSTIQPYKTRGFGVREPRPRKLARRVKSSTMPFVGFLQNSDSTFRQHQEALDSFDTGPLFGLQNNETRPDFRFLNEDRGAIDLVKGSSTSDRPSLTNKTNHTRRRNLKRYQWSLDLFNKSLDNGLRNFRPILGDFIAILKLSTDSGFQKSTHMSCALSSHGSNSEAQRILNEFSGMSQIDAQTNFIKFVIYTISHTSDSFEGEQKFLNSLFSWISQKHLYGMLNNIFSLKSPAVQLLAYKAISNEVAMGDPEIVKVLLSALFKIQDGAKYVNRMLIQVVCSRNVSAVQALLKANADPNYALGRYLKKTPLSEALKISNNSKIVQVLIDAGAKPGLNCMQVVARRGDCESAEILLQAGCNNDAYLTPKTREYLFPSYEHKLDVPERLRWCSTPLQMASVIGHLAMVRLLVQYTPNLSTVDPQVCKYSHTTPVFEFFTSGSFWNPLKLAVAEGHIDIVKVLLDAGAGPDEPRFPFPPMTSSSLSHILSDEDQNIIKIIEWFKISHATALQIAIEFESIDPGILLENGASVNEETILGTALQVACKKGNLELAQLLLQKGAHIKSRLPAAGKTALQYGVESNNLELVLFLISRGADVNETPAVFNGRSALQSACERGNMMLAEILVENGALVNCPPANWYGLTALQAAAKSGNIEIIEFLLEQGGDINASGASMAGGKTALECAVISGNHEVVRRVLEAGANVNAVTSILPSSNAVKGKKGPQQRWLPSLQAGATALQLAARHGSLAILRLLLGHGAEINQQGAESFKIRFDFMGPSMNTFDVRVQRGRSAIQEALSMGHENVIDELLHTGVIDIQSEVAHTCLNAPLEDMLWILPKMGLTSMGFDALDDALQKILDRFKWLKDMNDATGEFDGDDLYSTEDLFDVCEVLLEAGAMAPPEALVYVNQIPDVKLARLLLLYGADPNADGIGMEMTPLLWAIESHNPALVKMLLEAGADPDLTWDGWVLPLKETKDAAIAQMLLDHGADPNFKVIRDMGDEFRRLSAQTPLQHAAAAGLLEMAVALIRAGADPAVEHTFRPGHTALHNAARGGHMDLAALLVENDSEKDTLAERCRTAAAEADVNDHMFLADWLREEARKGVSVASKL